MKKNRTRQIIARQRRSLHLNRETLLSLNTSSELEKVAGGENFSNHLTQCRHCVFCE